MAKKSSRVKNEKRRLLVAKFAERRKEIKQKLSDPSVTDEEFYNLNRALAKLPRNSCPVRVRNRCKITGRPRGYLRKFGVSRITFRELASNAQAPGVAKSSW